LFNVGFSPKFASNRSLHISANGLLSLFLNKSFFSHSILSLNLSSSGRLREVNTTVLLKSCQFPL
jgi:hypothetical protein